MFLKMMRSLSLKLKEKYYGNREHPYRTYETIVLDRIDVKQVVLDVGCGRKAPILQKLIGKCDVMVGVDIGGFDKIENKRHINLMVSDASNLGLRDNSVDVVISRTLLEHVKDTVKVYKEINRVLRPGGHFIFLTPNLFDYASLSSKLIPNCFHPYIVRITEGRNPEDTFPTYYRSNTQRAIEVFSKSVGFKIERISFLGQYPSYLLFNPLLFLLGTGYDRLICQLELLRFLRPWILAVLQKSKIGT